MGSKISDILNNKVGKFSFIKYKII